MSNIKQDMLSGIFWSAIEKYSGLIVSIIVSAILARLLTPKEFGIVAIATVIIHFLQMFATMGIGPAIIQRNDLNKNDLNSIFTFSLIVGIILSVFFYILSWGIADFYNNEQLIPVCQILCFQLFFAAANMVPNALMAKNKRFKDIARRTLILQTISGIISVISAYYGAGIYALLISPIFTAIGIFLYNRHFYPLYINTNFTLAPIKRIFSFSSYQFLFEFVNYFSRNLDKLIIGRFMTMAELGYYEKSYRLMQLPLNNITAVINPVLQPVLNPLQNDKKDLSKKYNKIIKFVSTISFPLGILLAYTGEEIIPLFYGPNWSNAIPVFRILALSIPLQMIMSTNGAIFMICNNTKAQFYTGIRNTSITILGFFISAIFWGNIESIAWSWVITLCINFITTYFILYNKVLRTSMTQMLIFMIKPLINAILLAIMLELIKSAKLECASIVSLFIKCTSAFILSIIFIQTTGQYNIYKMIINKIEKIKK